MVEDTDLSRTGGVRSGREGERHVVEVVLDGCFVDADQGSARFRLIVVQTLLASVGTVVGRGPGSHLIG